MNAPIRQQQAEQTRKIILETAFRLFEEKGYEKVSMREIAREAGVTTGALYHHFPAKKEIIFQSFWEDAGRLDTNIEQFRSENPLEDLRELLCEYMPERVLREGKDTTRYFWTNYVNYSRVTTLEKALAIIITRGVEMGIFKSDIPIDLLTEYIRSIYHAAVYQYIFSAEPVDLKAVIARRLDLALSGIAADEYMQKISP